MKKYLLLLFSLSIVVMIQSCEKDDDDDNDSNDNSILPPSGNVLRFDANGSTSSFPTIIGQLDTNSIIIGGLPSSGNYPQMIITIPKDSDPTTFNYPVNIFDTSIVTAGILYSVNDSTAYLLPNNGSLVLSKHDKTTRQVEGSFNVVLYKFQTIPDSIVISNGAFRVNY